jgi:O-antigen ligase
MRTANWVLMLAPTALASYSLSRAVGAAAILALTFVAFTTAPSNRLNLTWPCAILPAISLPIVLRWYDSATMVKAGFFILACAVIARAVSTSASKRSAVISLIDGAGLFGVASVALWLAGFTSNSTRTGGLWNTMTGGARVIFPLSNSWAVTPNVAAVYLAAVVPLIIADRRHRLPRLIAFVCGLAVLVLSDSRTGLVAAFSVIAMVVLIPRFFRRVTPPMVFVCLLMPFIYGAIQSIVNWALMSFSTAVPWLVRPTLNGRDYVWLSAINHYRDRVDYVHQMFGYGIGGQAKSGAVEYYWSRDYANIASADLASPHNSMLQLLFDGGWLAVAIFVVTVVCCAWALSRSASTVEGTSALLALVVTGITGTALSPSHMEPTWWLLLALVMIAFAREEPGQAIDKPTLQPAGRVPAENLRQMARAGNLESRSHAGNSDTLTPSPASPLRPRPR